MKQVLLCIVVALHCGMAHSQSIGIGTNTPHNSALLDLTSTNKGLLVPRMTAAQRTAIVSPSIGLMVFETTTATVWVYNGSSWVQQAAGGASPWATSATNIYNSNTGNVGIGMSSSLREKLSLKGDLFITHVNPNDLSGGNQAAINLHGANTGGSRINFLNPDTSVGAFINYYRLSSQLNGFTLSHGDNSNQISLNQNGNVGIGKIATEKLDVNGRIRGRSNLVIDSNVAVAGRIDADGVIEGRGLSSTSVLYVNGTSLLQGAVTGSSSATFSSTITSNESLVINDVSATLQLKAGSANKGYFQLSGDNVRMGTNSGNDAGSMIFRMDGTDRIFITNTGNMGIGTASPGGRLHVAGRSYMNNGGGEALAIDGSNPFIQFYQAGVARSFIQQLGTTLKMGVNSGKLNLDATQIAIGGVLTTADAYKLSVTGKIICEELKVKLSGAWPDYVFADDYKLKSLSEVEQFIQKNKHLPNIPAASELEKDGIEVGDMQKKMMEKIEELTLYIIDLQKQVDELKKK